MQSQLAMRELSLDEIEAVGGADDVEPIEIVIIAPQIRRENDQSGGREWSISCCEGNIFGVNYQVDFFEFHGTIPTGPTTYYDPYVGGPMIR